MGSVLSELGPSLQVYVETRLAILAKEVESVRLHIAERFQIEKDNYDNRLKDIELRYQQRFSAQETAITKSETATEKRLESMNEFREALTDQAATMMPRIESNGLHAAMTDKINRLEQRMDSREGQLRGTREYRDDNHKSIVLWIAIAMAILSTVALLIKFK